MADARPSAEPDPTAAAGPAAAAGSVNSHRGGGLAAAGSCNVDVAIIGDGLVGTACALAAARVVGRVALIGLNRLGSSGPPQLEPHHVWKDARPIALGLGSRRILNGLDVWKGIAPEAAPIRRIHVSERGRFGVTRIRAEDYGLGALGYVTDSGRLARALSDAVSGTPEITAIEATEITEVREVEGAGGVADVVDVRGDPDSMELGFAFRASRDAALETRGATVRARLVVVAEGGHSDLRARLGFRVTQTDYGQCAIAASVIASRPHAGGAFERFTPRGPVALLPTPHPWGYGLVWTMPADKVGAVADLDDNAFLAALADTFGTRAGRFLSLGPRALFPLSLVCTKEPARLRVALVGNAAHRLHPVAGQGFNLGLRDVAALAEAIGGAGRDPGAPDVLAGWSERRRRDHRTTVRFTHWLIRAFASRLEPISVTRGLALAALDVMPPLKRELATLAMGLSAPQSRLSRDLSP